MTGTATMQEPARVNKHEDEHALNKSSAPEWTMGEAEPASPGREEGREEGDFVGVSAAVRGVREEVGRIAKFDIPVLLIGESGTGKEVVARLIHQLSYRSQRSFLKVNCAALPGELLESELFGHEAGAFTGATRSKPGKFEVGDKGTILLDEVAEMPVGLQAKLLHVLQDGEFTRLGGVSGRKVDVRIIAATNVDLPQAIQEKRFRPDLYYRLNTYSIRIAPLRERKEDIAVLLRHFVRIWARRYGRPEGPLSGALLEGCRSYGWPGNVRELENFVRRYVIVGDEAQALSELKANGGGEVVKGSLWRWGAEGIPGDLKSQVRELKQALEREAIARALELTKGCRKEAAGMLRISVRALQYKIRECGLDGHGQQS